MIMNPIFYSPMFYPEIPLINYRPPKLYDLMDSIVNYGKEDKIKTSNLSKNARTIIFDFDYPLSSKVDKEKFETMILNHFILRRIGFETFTSFKIQLNVKLNEIMPLYNKMFDSLENWNIFDDGERIERISESENKLVNESETNGKSTEDLRYSDTPQNQIEELHNGNYVTDANFNQRTSENNDKSKSDGTSKSTEIINRSPADKIAIYKEFQENLKNIYTMIFKDLECLFYQLVD